MSEFGNVACFSITTLLVVSLANLILLIVMILESKKKCVEDGEVTGDGTFRIGALQQGSGPFSSSLKSDHKFMAALVLLKGNSMSLICGTVIVSKFWVLTAAHCCELIKIYPFERLKLSSNSENWKKGKKHSVENLVRHINFTSKSASFDVCLIKSGSPFKEINEQSVPLAHTHYQYVADTLGVTVGWSSRKTAANNNFYAINVNLIPFQRCKTLVKNDRVDETMVCAYNLENNDCRYDSGGPLIQNNIIIGIASFEPNCAKRVAPRVFTRMSYFEKWFQLVEKQNDIKIGAVFK